MYIIGCFLQRDSLTKSASPFLESSFCDSSEEFIFASIFISPNFFQVKSPFLRIDSRFEASVKWKRAKIPCSRRDLALLHRAPCTCGVSFVASFTSATGESPATTTFTRESAAGESLATVIFTGESSANHATTQGYCVLDR